MLDFSLSHIGINKESEKALGNDNKIFKLVDFPVKADNSYIFNGKEFKGMKSFFVTK